MTPISDAGPGRAGGARRLARAPALLLVLAFAVSLPAVTTRLYASDEIEYFAFLRSLWFDHDLSFDNEYRYFFDRGIARDFNFRKTFLELTTETGLRLNFGTIGCAVLWTPFYAVADTAVTVSRRFGSDLPADGYSRPYLAAVTYGSAVYGFLAVLLSAAVARRVVGQGPLAATLVWVSTPLLFYMYVAPGMAHACSAFAVTVFIAVWLRVREQWSIPGFAALGALAALMVMVREQDVLMIIGPVLDYGVAFGAAVKRRRSPDARRLVAGAVVGTLVAGVAYLPQVAAYLVLNGRVGPAPQVTAKMTWTAPHALEVLFSTEHGFLLWTPIAALSIAGLVWLSIRPALADPRGVESARRIGILALLMVAGQVFVNGSIGTWTQAGAFGQRRFVALTVVLVIGIAHLLAAVPRGVPRRLVSVAIGFCAWWNLGLMAQFGAGMMDRQRLELGRNAYQTFVTVPSRLPELAYRYMFDRSSFYRKQER